MAPRSHRSPRERAVRVRVRAARLLADRLGLRGALVLQRRCRGKPDCHGRAGRKAAALDLHTRSGGQRVRISIPPDHEIGAVDRPRFFQDRRVADRLSPPRPGQLAGKL